MIEVEHLDRQYGDFTAVDDVSFHIGAGEVVGLLGHNGAGKTTIMKVLTGYLEASAGRVSIDGVDLNDDIRAIQNRIGYLPENCPVYPDMTVIDYLDFQATLRGLKAPERMRAISRVIDRTALREKAKNVVSTLSRGYRQRVGVAQAILHDPDIVILDEPTNGLDPTQILGMRDLVRELATSATVIISTHILQEVQAVCDRVLILRQGRLAVDSLAADLQQGGRLQVTVDRNARASLVAVEGVTGVETSTVDGRTRHVLQVPLEAAPTVVKTLVEAGIAVYSVQPEKRDLETVFAEVNAAIPEVQHG